MITIYIYIYNIKLYYVILNNCILHLLYCIIFCYIALCYIILLYATLCQIILYILCFIMFSKIRLYFIITMFYNYSIFCIHSYEHDGVIMDHWISCIVCIYHCKHHIITLYNHYYLCHHFPSAQSYFWVMWENLSNCYDNIITIAM